MQQKVLLICKIYLFCVYFSLNNFNYPKKDGNPIKITKLFRKIFAEFPQNFCEKNKQNLLGFWGLRITGAELGVVEGWARTP